jgi:hypothetical protein
MASCELQLTNEPMPLSRLLQLPMQRAAAIRVCNSEPMNSVSIKRRTAVNVGGGYEVMLRHDHVAARTPAQRAHKERPDRLRVLMALLLSVGYPPGPGMATQPSPGQGMATKPPPGQGMTMQPSPGQGITTQPSPGQGMTTQPPPGQGMTMQPSPDPGMKMQPSPGPGMTPRHDDDVLRDGSGGGDIDSPMQEDENASSRWVASNATLGLNERFNLVSVSNEVVERRHLLLVHEATHVDRVKKLTTTVAPSVGGHGTWWRDTYWCKDTYEAALVAAGAVVDVVRAVMSGEAENGFAVVRPPGHHADSDACMGFCVFNNIAVAARYAQEEHTVRAKRDGRFSC